MALINFHNAEFITSAPSLKQCPPEIGAEVAFAGRSNAGKSSAINALTQNSKLAKTSKTPGRTQLINFFDLGNERRLVDLPGYGYAKVPLETKRKWQAHLSEYLQKRECLRGLVLLMDIRHPFFDYDTTMLNWALDVELPTHILLTKSDKLSSGVAKTTLLKARQHLSAFGADDLVSVQTFSALKKEGMSTLAEQLSAWLADEAPADEPQNG